MVYKVISTFSGCGGSSLGYQMAGFKVLAAVEFVKIAADTYAKNFPNTLIFRHDIRNLKGEQILKMFCLKPGQLDLLDGSPPCASFSTLGKREEHWGKVKKYSETKQRCDDLLFEYARMIKEIQPKVFVAENVYGLVIGEAKQVFNEALGLFKSQDYKVSCRLLNAKYFNVAQNRPRVIFIGVRNDLGVEPSHPRPQAKPLTMRSVLSSINNTEGDLAPSWIKKHYKIYEYLLKLKPGESAEKYHPKGSFFGLRRLEWDKPTGAILQTDGRPSVACGAIHPDKNRKLTIKELKRVCSFPDSFILLGTFQQQWERLGRAVPPNMMRAIAEHIRYKILDKINGIENDYNPSFYNEEEEKTGQTGFDFVSTVQQFREYK